jgi:hypothetical protein
MTFTAEEKRLLHLYCSGSASETAAVVQDALNDITDPEERAVAGNLLWKLEGMSGTALDSFFDMGDIYGG